MMEASMGFTILKEPAGKYATSEKVIRTTQDMLDLMAFAGENGTNLLLLHEENLDPTFYDLSTGLAGEIAQKLFNYHTRLAVVGSFTTVRSQRFREFMVETNKGAQLIFALDETKALAWLLRRQKDS